MLVRIFADGASSNNQDKELRIGGYGALIYIKDNDKTYKKEVSGRKEGATNNEMELVAVLEGLKAISNDKRPSAKVNIQSDSKYVVNIFSSWIEGWKKNNWRKKDNDPIENLTLIQEIDNLIGEYHIVKFNHVKRCSDQWMCLADELAKKQTNKKQAS